MHPVLFYHPKKLLYQLYHTILQYTCGAKGSGRPDPFQILSPKAQAEEENAKEGPKLLGGIVEDPHVLGELMSWKGKGNTPPKAALPVVPSEGTSVGGQLWEHGERAIVKEPVTFALNARSWQSGRINEGMTPEQCHPVYCNSQQVEGSVGWDKYSSSDLHNQ